MPVPNPFDLILNKIDQLALIITESSQKPAANTSEAQNGERLLSLEEVAEVIRKPLATVRYYIHHRSLPAIKIGRSYVVKYRELITWIDSQVRQSDSPSEALTPLIENRIRYRKS